MDARLVGILAEVLDLKESDVHRALTKAEVGTWDSLKQMDLVLGLEGEFEIALEIADIVRMVSVEGIECVLREKGVSLAD